MISPVIFSFNFAVLLDGPSGEKASSQADFTLDLVGLGEKEIHLLQKFLEIIRTNPAKAEKMVKEEEKDDLDGSGAQVIRVTEPTFLSSDRGIILHKRAAEMKMAKKKKLSKPKKADETKKKEKSVRSKKVKRVKSKLEKTNKKRKPPKKRKNKRNNKNLERKKKKKIKLISRTNKIKQKRKQMHQNKQKSEFLVKSQKLENCTSMWSEFTRVGLGLATTLKKQVVDIDLVIKVNSLPGKIY